jgi:hypothetical protein
MKKVSREQAMSVMSTLMLNINWDELDGDILQREVVEDPKGVGARATAFFKRGCRPIVVGQSSLAVNRSKLFNPAKFIGRGWRIEEQDERSLTLSGVDILNIRLESTLRGDEASITGEENLNRLKASGLVYLDAAIFRFLWDHQYLIPESWKEKTNGSTTNIFFDGTVLLHPLGDRCVIYLYWYNDEWNWECHNLSDDRYPRYVSAVLASNSVS